MLISVLEKRKIIDRFGVDKATSTFALALKEVAILARKTIEAEKSERESLCNTDREMSFTDPNTSRLLNLVTDRINSSNYGNILAAIKLPTHRSTARTNRTYTNEGGLLNGVFIIDQGRCSIINKHLGKGKDSVFLEINRSDIIGEST